MTDREYLTNWLIRMGWDVIKYDQDNYEIIVREHLRSNDLNFLLTPIEFEDWRVIALTNVECEMVKRAEQRCYLNPENQMWIELVKII
jgi:hypothetical protein